MASAAGVVCGGIDVDFIFGAMGSDWGESDVDDQCGGAAFLDIGPDVLAAGHGDICGGHAGVYHRDHCVHDGVRQAMVWMGVSADGDDGDGVSEDRVSG